MRECVDRKAEFIRVLSGSDPEDLDYYLKTIWDTAAQEAAEPPEK